MAEYKNAAGGFKEAVCIDVGRVYDSCCDRDCLEDLRCFFTPRGQDIIDQALSIRARSAEVINVFIDVEPVNFNRCYYSCDMTFFFLVNFEVFTGPRCAPIDVKGICFFEKKVILFGSEGNVKVFSSEFTPDENDDQLPVSSNLPVCSVDVVDPVVLDAKLCPAKCCDPVRPIPACVCNRVGGEIVQSGPFTNNVTVTLGLFTITKLIRNVQILIPVYDFCIPEKECVGSSDNPCELFRNIQFPIDEFFPPHCDSGNCGKDNCCR